MISCFAVPTAMAASATISEGTYYIYSKLDNSKVVDVSNGGTADRTNVQLYKYNGTNAQKFKIKKNGNYYTISCVCSGKMLDVAGGSNASGTNVWQYTSNGSNAQKWEFIDAGNGYYYIRSALGTYLDVSGGRTANGTNIQAYKGNWTDSQKWKLVNVSDNSGWQYPMKGYTVTNKYKAYSSTKAKAGRPYHAGIDMVSTNTNIYAAADGKVVYRAYSGDNGNHIILSHTINGVTVKTLYSHLSSFAGCPEVGKTVKKGQKIGVMGNTGYSTGAHLHFAVFTGSGNDPWGYAASKDNSDILTQGNQTFYNPNYVINNKKLP